MSKYVFHCLLVFKHIIIFKYRFCTNAINGISTNFIFWNNLVFNGNWKFTSKGITRLISATVTSTADCLPHAGHTHLPKHPALRYPSIATESPVNIVLSWIMLVLNITLPLLLVMNVLILLGPLLHNQYAT